MTGIDVVGGRGISTAANSYGVALDTTSFNGWTGVTFWFTPTTSGTAAVALAATELNYTVVNSSSAYDFTWVYGNSITYSSSYTIFQPILSNYSSASLFGGDGNDTLQGGQFKDTLDGGTGNDVADYSYNSFGTTYDLSKFSGATAQTVTINFLDIDTVRNIEGIIAGAGADSLLGDSKANYLSGGAGNDTINGGLGSDTIAGGIGNNILNGGVSASDVDVLDYSTSSYNLSLNIGNFSDGNTATIAAYTGSSDTVSNFEGIIGGTGNDTFIGDARANSISGGGGADNISGGLGSDTISGGAGKDTLDGNGSASTDATAADVLDYTYVTGNMTLNVSSINSNNYYSYSVAGSATDIDQIRNFEGIMGGSGHDSFTGDGNANYLSGGAGNDTLIGGDGKDTLDGGEGNDSLSAIGNTLGADILRGGAGNDSMLIDQSFLGGNGSIDGGAGNDSLSFAANSGNMTLTSTNFSNVVTSMEMLDFTAVGTNVTMSLNASDISSITGESLSTGSGVKLDIYQNLGDSISFSTSGAYSFDTTTASGVTTYTLYNAGDVHDQAHQLAQLIVH